MKRVMAYAPTEALGDIYQRPLMVRVEGSASLPALMRATYIFACTHNMYIHCTVHVRCSLLEGVHWVVEESCSVG